MWETWDQGWFDGVAAAYRVWYAREWACATPITHPPPLPQQFACCYHVGYYEPEYVSVRKGQPGSFMDCPNCPICVAMRKELAEKQAAIEAAIVGSEAAPTVYVPQSMAMHQALGTPSATRYMLGGGPLRPLPGQQLKEQVVGRTPSAARPALGLLSTPLSSIDAATPLSGSEAAAARRREVAAVASEPAGVASLPIVIEGFEQRGRPIAVPSPSHRRHR